MSEKPTTRLQWRMKFENMKVGDSFECELTRAELNNYRVLSNKFGKFSFIEQGKGAYRITRKHNTEKSLRSKILAVLQPLPVRQIIDAHNLNHVQQYVRQFNLENKTLYRAEHTQGGVLIWRDLGQELCQPLIDAINKATDHRNIWAAFDTLNSAILEHIETNPY